MIYEFLDETTGASKILLEALEYCFGNTLPKNDLCSIINS